MGSSGNNWSFKIKLERSVQFFSGYKINYNSKNKERKRIYNWQKKTEGAEREHLVHFNHHIVPEKKKLK